jgi:hypothetical protein
MSAQREQPAGRAIERATFEPRTLLAGERELAALCTALLDESQALSAGERQLVSTSKNFAPSRHRIALARAAIRSGEDPLGDMFSSIRSAAERREIGAVYTPATIVQSMITWLKGQDRAPARIVDPGAGSGRFILAAGAAFPKAHLVAIEMDPLAALMLRANLAARRWTKRTRILVADYRKAKLPAITGRTAYCGNPPYLRHHAINDEWKRWYATRFAEFGIKASALAGLHLHFFLQTYLLAKAGDIGAFVTSAEWIDTNYGSALRQLLIEKLGGVALHVLEPTVEAFPGTATTAAITCFRVGESESPVRVRSVKQLRWLNGLTRGNNVPRQTFQQSSRWSIIVKPTGIQKVDGDNELGELFRVHRGQVTGANDIWIAGDHATMLPDRVKLPSVTRAKDLIDAGPQLRTAEALRRVIDLPANLDSFSDDERAGIDRFLAWAKTQGADQSYIARHRQSWWSVGLNQPAPILCTYMARRPPQFTLNSCGARHINIAHGLYPRAPIEADRLALLVKWLNGNTNTSYGRTYAGGLTKFEPKEVERLRIPDLATL